MTIRNLEQLTISSFDYIIPFTNDFIYLIATSRKAFDEELCNKYFVKLPRDLGRQIHLKWNENYGENLGLGIGSRVQFTFMFLSEKCNELALQGSARLFTVPNNIVVDQHHNLASANSRSFRSRPLTFASTPLLFQPSRNKTCL